MKLSSALLNHILYQPNKHSAIVNATTSSALFPFFVASLNDLAEKDIYQSSVHGRAHLERVSLFAFCISLMEDLPLSDVALILEIAKYHDMGRTNDHRDPMHGFCSADKYSRLNRLASRGDLTVVTTVMAAHSISDTKFDLVFDYFFGKDRSQYDRVFKFYQIIKDADGLDRFRLGDHQLDVRMLRLDSSKKLVQFSYDINQIEVD